MKTLEELLRQAILDGISHGWSMEGDDSDETAEEFTEKWLKYNFDPLQYKGEQWISVEERLPEKGTRVLACDGNIIFTSIYELNPETSQYQWLSMGFFSYDVTHWMKLPSAPIKKETKP